jgi:hypothetical protein
MLPGKAGPRSLGPAFPCVFDAADGLRRRSKCLSVQGEGGSLPPEARRFVQGSQAHAGSSISKIPDDSRLRF